MAPAKVCTGFIVHSWPEVVLTIFSTIVPAIVAVPPLETIVKPLLGFVSVVCAEVQQYPAINKPLGTLSGAVPPVAGLDCVPEAILLVINGAVAEHPLYSASKITASMPLVPENWNGTADVCGAAL